MVEVEKRWRRWKRWRRGRGRGKRGGRCFTYLWIIKQSENSPHFCFKEKTGKHYIKNHSYFYSAANLFAQI